MKKTGKKKEVKLYFYQKVSDEETVIDGFKAKAWEDFLIVKVSQSQLFDSNQHEALVNVLRKYSEENNKEVIVIDDKSDIEFYAVEVEEDDE